VAKTVKPSSPGNHISLDDFEAIEADIRQRMDDLDQQYHAYFEARRKLEAELEEFQKQKRAMLDFVRKHRNRRGPDAIRPPARPAAKVIDAPPTDDGKKKKLPWGGFGFGQDKVLYVVEQSGRAGLSRGEIVDRIAEISGERELLPSVTVWLYRLKKDGKVRNRNRRWYAIRRREDAP
jgi:hypothetical protein